MITGAFLVAFMQSFSHKFFSWDNSQRSYTLYCLWLYFGRL